MKNFSHGPPKNRHNAASVTVSDIVIDWASWFNRHDGISKIITDPENPWRSYTVTIEPKAQLPQPKPIYCDEK